MNEMQSVMKAFENNMNFVDIGIRYMIMMVIMILGGILMSPVLWVLGVFFFLIGITGWCPLYHMLGINTAKE
jgi:hypothetical protein